MGAGWWPVAGRRGGGAGPGRGAREAVCGREAQLRGTPAWRLAALPVCTAYVCACRQAGAGMGMLPAACFPGGAHDA